MNFLYLLLFLYCSTIHAKEPELQNEKMLADQDSLRIHFAEEGIKNYFKEPLKLFDNARLEGEPSYLIGQESLIDVKNGQKKYVYRDFYTMIPKKELSEYGPIYIQKNYLPVDFIRRGNEGFVISIERKTNILYKVFGKELYFELKVESFVDNSAYSYVLFGARKFTSGSFHDLLKQKTSAAAKVEELKDCIKKRDDSCLFRMIPSLKEALVNWTAFQDKNICQKIKSNFSYYSDDSEELKADLSRIQKVKIDWNFFDKFVKMNGPDFFFREEISYKAIYEPSSFRRYTTAYACLIGAVETEGCVGGPLIVRMKIDENESEEKAVLFEASIYDNRDFSYDCSYTAHEIVDYGQKIEKRFEMYYPPILLNE